MAPDERSAERLAREARLASRIRALKTDSDVVALHVERVRTQVEWLTWTSIGLGLLFTLVNVQQFAAGSATPSQFSWWIAWLLDPMVSLALIAVLRAEMVTAKYQLRLDGWAQATKWFTLTATYVMNTWSSYAMGSPSQVILHSVPVATVFVVANAAPGIRDRLTEAVIRAAEEAERLAETSPVSPSHEQPVEAVSPDLAQPPLVSIPSPEPYKVVTRDERSIVSTLTKQPVPSPGQPVIPVALRAQEPVQPRPAPIVPKPVPAKKPSSEVGSQTDPLQIEVERMALELGRRPGIGMVRKALSIGESRARRLIAAIPDPIQTMNGHRPGSAVKL